VQQRVRRARRSSRDDFMDRRLLEALPSPSRELPNASYALSSVNPSCLSPGGVSHARSAVASAGVSGRVAGPVSSYRKLCRTATARHQRYGPVAGSASVEQLALAGILLVLVLCRTAVIPLRSRGGVAASTIPVIVVLAGYAVVGVQVGGVRGVPVVPVLC
jgi:hypothetical protein